MFVRPVSLAVLATALMLSACGAGEDKVAPAADADATSTAPAAASTEAAAPVAFDVSAVPVSIAPLGAFPYLGLPQGYEAASPTTLDFTVFPVWTGEAFQMVEGKAYMSYIRTVAGKTMSRLELQRNLDQVVTDAGGVRVAQGAIPSEAMADLPESMREELNMGLGDVYNEPATTYVIRRADKTIWVHFSGTGSSASWSIIEAQPFVATAGLTPSD